MEVKGPQHFRGECPDPCLALNLVLSGAGWTALNRTAASCTLTGLVLVRDTTELVLTNCDVTRGLGFLWETVWKAQGGGMPAEILKSVKMFIRVTDVYLGSVFTWDREYCLREQNSVWLKLREYTVSWKHGLRINERLCTLYWNLRFSPKCSSFLPKAYAGKWHAQIYVIRR